ncbi:hypothetical protein SLNSH_14405 [Alsobacter soli]|uniref:SD-repeat containing protein B domain-containing protein n=1 Tax=Alsobacter soli TaxID=2109933 RepID=A0A2T1HRZ9_9HYPH|nr:hypothetical protein [Alsobacter soli]PSC04413.1 hypothetical protein SLNSH_14405 [Alsobacter soli]
MRAHLMALAALALAISPALSAGRKGTRFWNLTGAELNQVRLAPAGTTQWGRNQCENDRDGTVDFDERLQVTDVQPGVYDVQVRDVSGRTCLAHNVTVKEGEVFAVHERDLTNCSK